MKTATARSAHSISRSMCLTRARVPEIVQRRKSAQAA
jgi:hypothetical protein